MEWALKLFSQLKINPIFVENDFLDQNLFVKPNDKYMLQFLFELKIYMENNLNNNENLKNKNEISLSLLEFCTKADAAIDYLSQQSIFDSIIQNDCLNEKNSLLVNCEENLDKNNIDTLSIDSLNIMEYKNLKKDPLNFFNSDDEFFDMDANDKKLINSLKKTSIKKQNSKPFEDLNNVFLNSKYEYKYEYEFESESELSSNFQNSIKNRIKSICKF